MKQMKKTTLLTAIILLALSSFSQRYITKNGNIKFYSETPMETIEAHNNQVNSAFDISTGDFVFKILMKSFEFEKALMQEHFNENYVESDKYPNAMFKGKVANLNDIDFTTNGEYHVIVEGEMTIHGETQNIQTTGTFKVTDESIEGSSVFIVKPEEYKIRIPKTVVQNIAEEIEVTVNVSLKELKR
jgi:polyisoprenoid-binding protein YceI